MKVLHYCDAFSRLSQTFIYDVIVELDSSRVENVVVAVKILNLIDRPFRRVIKLTSSWNDLLDKILKKGLEQTGLSAYDWEKETLRIKQNSFYSTLKTEQPDVIHAHFGTHGSIILPSAKKLKVPVVVSFHGFDAFQLPNLPGWMEKLEAVFSQAAAITVVSQFMKFHLVKLGCPSEKLHVVHVGKKIKDYNFRRTINLPVKKFLSIGRLAEKKGHADIIKAFYSLRVEFPDLTLKIIGEGPLKEDLIALITFLGMEKSVEILGAKSHAQTKKYLAAADAFILCSKVAQDGDMEGIPTVLMEAQCMGLPCVSTFHSGIPEVIPMPNYWTLAKEGDIGSIASKIRELLVCPTELLNNATLLARQKMEEEFNLETEVEVLKALYNKVI
jgi:colanic acid/amylovoran biosynthesis glycosyltransferase